MASGAHASPRRAIAPFAQPGVMTPVAEAFAHLRRHDAAVYRSSAGGNGTMIVTGFCETSPSPHKLAVQAQVQQRLRADFIGLSGDSYICTDSGLENTLSDGNGANRPQRFRGTGCGSPAKQSS